jgi:ABC-type glycerol-3-phosphate transport system substrate-binding protein
MKNTSGIVGASLAALIFTATGAAAQSQDWKAEWDRTVALANREGHLTLAVASGEDWRTEVGRFQQAFPGIKLEMSTFSGRDFWPRFIKEREAGQYLWDVRVGSIDNQEYVLKNAGNMQPVRDLLLLPEVVDDDSWYGGFNSLFLDHESKFFLGFIAIQPPPGYFNKSIVGPAFSTGDMNNRQWSGKISLADPRGGAGIANLGSINREHGLEFVREILTEQKPVITNVPRQQLEWLLSGRYPIAIGIPDALLVDYRNNGGDTGAMGYICGTRSWTISSGALSVPTHNPHPAATKLFVNWILTKDVQTQLMKGVQMNSRRKDVPIEAPNIAVDYSQFDETECQQSEAFLPSIKSVQDMLRVTTIR